MVKEKEMNEMTLLDIGGGFSFNNTNDECNFPNVAT